LLSCEFNQQTHAHILTLNGCWTRTSR